jgi:squalene-hopene/tetraprenyl-beta-curcumene cyclase
MSESMRVESAASGDSDERIRVAHRNALAQLLAMRNDRGHWEGRLSSSALSTATAAIALRLAGDGAEDDRLVQAGAQWLVANQNADGGWGDTLISDSNLSTTLICMAALQVVGADFAVAAESSGRATQWVERQCGDCSPETLARKVADRYGRDRTFSVPILMVCALGGLLDADQAVAWRRVLPLPFELATFPRRWFAALRLPVVSYALPALIAIGYARFVRVPPLMPLRWLRRWAWPRASRLLQQIQPEGGGFLEATPLTSFVTIALAEAGEVGHPVVRESLGFLRRSVREDGSWPIDTNLATWATTLAVKAVAAGESDGRCMMSERETVRGWLLGQQYREIHPFTHAAPGGWAWTDLPGGVPDADDTAGALLALHTLADDPKNPEADLIEAAEAGCRWLLNLQNRDGGMPTFCRGWGALPFDRSAPDLTAHALRAWQVWLPHLGQELAGRVGHGQERALGYLCCEQRLDGSWVPLWFGNQYLEEEVNPVYGTAKVLLGLVSLGDHPVAAPLIRNASHWLVSAQHDDGSWGGNHTGEASLEETALALEALLALPGVSRQVTELAVRWLAEKTEEGTAFPAAPIGFYFAKLWYFEEIYPVVWTVSAFGRFLQQTGAAAGE